MSEAELNHDESSENLSREAPSPLPLNLSADSSVDLATPEWRDEVAAKLQQYRSRRKSRGPKYPSLHLPFERPEFSRSVAQEPASRSSLAVEHLVERTVDRVLDLATDRQKRDPQATSPLPLDPAQLPDEPLFFQTSQPEPRRDLRHDLSEPPRQETVASTNLIEFPRYSTPAVDWEELAEPVIERPRILEVPDLSPPQPALGGILLEPDAEVESADAQLQLRPAPIQRRMLATMLDALFVGLVTVFGGWIFFQLTHAIPPRPQLLIAAALIPAIFWLGYQYALLVMAGGTLGQRACKLELAGFDGFVPTMARRRWRFLSSLLSAAAVMLGYVWALLDEDGLCWHDRISRTYLRCKS